VELPAVTKEEAEEKYLDTTSVTRAMTPPVATAVAARDDMLKDRFNYVSQNLNPESQYIVMGGKGAVAPAAIGQGSFLIAGLMVLLGGIGGVVYIKTQWGVSTPMELGDRLREKGAARREAIRALDVLPPGTLSPPLSVAVALTQTQARGARALDLRQPDPHRVGGRGEVGQG
jgi:hypothetical protein